MEIYEMTGKKILREENNFKNVNILHLGAGIYNVKLIFMDGKSVYKLFIKK